MLKCQLNNICPRFQCDLSCKYYATFDHWAARCGLTVANPAYRAKPQDILKAEQLIERAEKDVDRADSNYIHIAVEAAPKDTYFANLVSYALVSRQCRNIGFYHGVYKLNFSKYLDEIKATWSSRKESESLEKMKIWIDSAKYLVIYNMGLVRFGDFESQTLLTLFQSRYDEQKFTLIVLEDGKFSLPGKNDSLFYQKLKNEVSCRGVKL